MTDPLIRDRLESIYTWLREPDTVEDPSLEWLANWVNRRPIADFAVVSMLIPLNSNPEGWREADGVALPPITWAEET
jgi:hypothetical protein